MKKALNLILLLGALAVKAVAQGGDNAQDAQNNPVAIPFVANGSLCNANADYNNIGSDALPSTAYTWGKDWLYYFTASRSEKVQVLLSDMQPARSYFSISVWTGVPGQGTCVGAVADFSATGEQGLIFETRQGQSYYIMVDTYDGCFQYKISTNPLPQLVCNPACSNMDFETGNYNGWTGSSGSITCGAINAQYPVYTPSTFVIPDAQHTIVTGVGTDACGGFPIVCPGGTYSAMIGDGQNVGSLGGDLTQQFQVTASNAAFTYKYAAVVQDAQHQPNEQPWFQVDMYDQNNNIIQCAHYLVVGGPNIPNFFPANCSFGVWYRPWTTVNVDLTPYIGTCVTIKFTVGDCCYGGHFGYAYIDCSCVPMQISGNDSICIGQSTTLQAPLGSASYQWSTGATTSSITVSPTTMTIYTCTLTSITNSACTTVLKDTVWVFPSPTPQFTSAITTCGTTVNFTNTSTGGTGYSWDFGDNTTSALQNPTHTYGGPGTYTVTLSVSSGACTATITQAITIVNGITVAPTNTNPLCSGQSTGTATATPSGGATPYTYAWQGGQITQTATGLAAGTYTVLVTDNNGCTGTMSITITQPPPLSTSTAATQSQCTTANGTATVTPSGGTSPYTYLWNNGQTGQTATGLSPNNYTVVVTDANGCTQAAVVTVTSTGSVGVNIQSTTNPLCNGLCTGTAIAAPNGGNSPYSYLWNNGQTGTNATGLCAGSYTVTITDNMGCTNTVVANITQPTPLSLTAASATACAGGTVTLNTTAGGGTPNYTYNWQPMNMNNSSITYSPTATTIYTVTITDANGCTTTATNTVTVNPLPVPAFIAPGVCVGDPTPFTNQSTGALTYSWDFGDNGTSNMQNPTHTYTTAGNYTVTLTASTGNGCTASATQAITVYPSPVAFFVPNTLSTTYTDPQFTFTNQSTGATTWYWNFGDGSPIDSVTMNPTHVFASDNSQTFHYTVTLTVINQWGCISVYTIEVTIEPEFTFYAPNCFTPNGDGKNEFFFGTGIGIKEFEIWIFDRWGNLIWDCNDAMLPQLSSKCYWDGRPKYGSREIAQEDVYVWKVRLLDVFDHHHQYIGHVSVVK